MFGSSRFAGRIQNSLESALQRRIKDLLAERVSSDLFGRAGELDVLLGLLADDGPCVVHVHGVAGIVSGTTYTGGSNLVDAVIRSLRKKLGRRAARIETLSGVGYRLRGSR